MKKILALTRYGKIGPSSRYRFYQYFPYLEKNGFQIDVHPFFKDTYTQKILLKSKNIFSINPFFSYWNRVIKSFSFKQYDLIWIEKELFPWIPSPIENLFLKTNIPIIIDFDDAVYHRYDQHSNFIIRKFLSNKIRSILKSSSLIIAGNEYIASYARKSNVKNVEIIPTTINTEKSVIKINYLNKNKFIVGWIGSSSTSSHINEISEVIINLCKENDALFAAVGVDKKKLNNFPVKIIKWKEDEELKEISKFDVGIMPLPNNPWEKGKCGLKLLQYMAAGLPVVASPVGINNEIVLHGKNGFLARNENDWIKYLNQLKTNPMLRKKMGQESLNIVKKKYSLSYHSKKLIKILNRFTVK